MVKVLCQQLSHSSVGESGVICMMSSNILNLHVPLCSSLGTLISSHETIGYPSINKITELNFYTHLRRVNIPMTLVVLLMHLHQHNVHHSSDVVM